MLPARDTFSLNRDFLIWLALDQNPFNFVEGKGINYFFRKNLPGICLPHPSTLSTVCLRDVYEMVEEKVKEDLRKCSHITLMFDGWTDRHNGFHYLGLRAKIIRDDWSIPIITLSTKLCPQDAQGMADHILTVLANFLPLEDFRKKTLFTAHDGASVMLKTSRLLEVTTATHCLAHVLHLLLVTGGINRIPDLLGILKKCKAIVNTLHFKGQLLKEEVKRTNERLQAEELLGMIEKTSQVQKADEAVAPFQEPEEEVVSSEEEEVTLAGPEKVSKVKRSFRLYNDVPTRWNSTYFMLKSLIDLEEETTQALKKTGSYDKLLLKQEWAVLKQVCGFLESFNDFTNIVSGGSACLSLVPLIRSEIQDLCEAKPADVSELKELKKNLLKNLDKRMSLNDTILLSTLLDPNSKNLKSLDLTHSQKVDMLEKACMNTAAEQSLERAPVQSSKAYGDEQISKKRKLLLKHCDVTKPDQEVREEISAYLSSKQPEAGDDENPEVFWKQNAAKFPRLALVARKYLTMSASSVPVESLFSVMGFMLNHRRSSMAPFRANELAFVHDNYSLYFPV